MKNPKSECDRASAVRRLVNLYVEQLCNNSDYEMQVGIADVLTEENISVVRDLNLYPEMDKPPIARAIEDYARNVAMTRAWMAPRRGAIQ